VLSLIMAAAETTSVGAGDMISSMLSDPRGAVAFLVQVLLGVGLGYYSVKIAKYLVALIAILIVGMMLNAWSLSQGSVRDVVENVGEEWSKIYPVLKSLATALGY